MSTPDRTKPQIYIERMRDTHVVRLVLGDERLISLVLTRTLENAAVLLDCIGDNSATFEHGIVMRPQRIIFIFPSIYQGSAAFA